MASLFRKVFSIMINILLHQLETIFVAIFHSVSVSSQFTFLRSTFKEFPIAFVTAFYSKFSKYEIFSRNMIRNLFSIKMEIHYCATKNLLFQFAHVLHPIFTTFTIRCKYFLYRYRQLHHRPLFTVCHRIHSKIFKTGFDMMRLVTMFHGFQCCPMVK